MAVIVDMGMPKDCKVCPMSDNNDQCNFVVETDLESRPFGCPLKSVDGLVRELHDTCHLGAFEWAIIRKYLGDVRFKEVEDGNDSR